MYCAHLNLKAVILHPVCKAPAQEPSGQLLEGHKMQDELLVSIPGPSQVHGLISFREAGLQDLVLNSLQAVVWDILWPKHRIGHHSEEVVSLGKGDVSKHKGCIEFYKRSRKSFS